MEKLIKNPLPDIQEARDAVSKLMSLQRDLTILRTEVRAIRQVKQIGLKSAAAICAILGSFLFLIWLGVEIHERGVAAWFVGLTYLVIFGLSGLLLWTWARALVAKEEDIPEPIPLSETWIGLKHAFQKRGNRETSLESSSRPDRLA